MSSHIARTRSLLRSIPLTCTSTSSRPSALLRSPISQLSSSHSPTTSHPNRVRAKHFSLSASTFNLQQPRSATSTSSRIQPSTLDPADVGVPKAEKVWGSADEAIRDLKSGSLVLSAGFGLCGVPQTLINAIRSNEKIQDLTVVSNNAGNSGNGGLSPLVKSGQISTMILSYVGTNKSLQEAHLAGKVTLELSPQGTIAERLRAGGAGIPAVITPTGAGTFVETGGIPRRLSLKDDTAEGGKQTVVLEGNKKKVMEFEGKRFLLEPAIKGDVAIIRAHKVDKAGNCVFRYTTKAFAGLMARAAKLTIVEAEHIVEIGQIPPEEVDLPGIYVDRIVPATAEKQIEITVLKEEPSSSTSSSASSSDAASAQKKDPARIRRELIARRAAKELKDGFYCNLGVGMPVLAASYLAPGTNVWLQSENGILGMGPYPTPEQVDADIINAGKETVTLLPGASVFDSVESFTMIRGGHVDVSILGAMQVSADGDLANFMIPNKLVKGMGGAMDLVSNPDETMVIVVTDHTDKNGRSKILQKCTLPLTGVRVASKIITDLCVFEVDRKRGGLTLTELARGVTVEDVRSKTDATFALADKIGTYE